MGWGFSLSRLNLSCFNSYPLLIILLPRTAVKNLYGRLLLAFKSWKQGQVTCEGHRNPVKMSRVGVREAKAKPSVAERGEGCGRQQAFHRYIGRKKEDQRKCGRAKWGRSPHDKGHGEGRGTPCLPCFGRYWQDLWELQAPEATGKG